MIAGIYARKSTEQNGVADEAKSVSRQTEQARKFAALHGWTIDENHIYIDDAVSGAEFTKRPGYMGGLPHSPRCVSCASLRWD